MTFGFDLDGTLDWPGMVGLANALAAAGHRIAVVTGGHADSGIWTEESRRAQLERLGLLEYALYRCMGATLDDIGREKARVCREQAVILMFEDSPIYAAHIRAAGVPCVLISP